MIKLWDGREYSEDSLLQVAPTLVAAAQSGNRILEIVNNDVVLSPCRRSFRVLIDALTLVCGFVAVFLIFLGSGQAGILSPFLDMIAVGLVPLRIGVNRWSKRIAEQIAINDGYVTITRSTVQRRFPLSECFWFYGALCHDGNRSLWSTKSAVCITHPELLGRAERGCIACGCTMGAFAVLKEFLKVARVPMLRRRSSSEYWIVSGACAVTFCLLRLIATVAGHHFGEATLQFLLAYVIAPPASWVCGAYASALLGNDRWALVQEYKSLLSICPASWVAAIGIKFNLGGSYFILIGIAFAMSAGMSLAITKRRYPINEGN